MKNQLLIAVVIITLLPFLSPTMSLATDIVVFAIAAMACNLLLGYGGMLSFGQGIFFGIGAYTASLILISYPGALWLAAIGASVLSGLVALLVGGLSIRRTGVYFVMLTFAFANMVYFAASTFHNVTGGENGIVDVPRPNLDLFGVTIMNLQEPVSFYIFVAISFFLVFVFLLYITEGAFGRSLQAIRDNEARAIALGYDPKLFKITAFVVSGLITGYAGAIYAMFLRFAPLSNIELTMSEIIVIITILGGTGSLLGALVGALIVLGMGEVLSGWWPRWHLVLGLAVIGMSLFMRGGVIGGLVALVAKSRDWLHELNRGGAKS